MTLLQFESVPIHESGESLVDLEAYNFILESVYFKQGLSNDSRMFLRKSVADKLLRIEERLQKYRFKIWDGFRPREVQNAIYEKFWKQLKTEHPDWDEIRLKTEVGIFVTDAKNPRRIPPHATGSTVDLTLTDIQGREIDMGTVFDHFGPEAASLYFEEHSENRAVKNNRHLLREAMKSEDFAIDKDEWWHFDYGNQKWAIELGRPEAFFGEAPTPPLNRV